MDILGKEGEKASEAIQNLSNRIEDLETHVNAVDNAVQDTQRESREMDLEVAEANRKRLVELEGLMKQLADVQRTSLSEIESSRSRQSRHESKFNSRLDSLEAKVDNIAENQNDIESLLERVEKKVFRVEEELNNEIGLNQSRIESKISEQKHENELSSLRKEISRLKTSINSLASDVDDEKVRIE